MHRPAAVSQQSQSHNVAPMCSVVITYKTTALEAVMEILEKMGLGDADPLGYRLVHREGPGMHGAGQ